MFFIIIGMVKVHHIVRIRRATISARIRFLNLTYIYQIGLLIPSRPFSILLFVLEIVLPLGFLLNLLICIRHSTYYREVGGSK